MSYLASQLNLSDGVNTVDLIVSGGALNFQTNGYPLQLNGVNIDTSANIVPYEQAISVPGASTFSSPAIVVASNGSVSVSGAFSSDGGITIANLNNGLNSLNDKTQFQSVSGSIMNFGGASQYSYDANIFVQGQSVLATFDRLDSLETSRTADESNITSLMSSMSAVQASQTTDEANIASVMASLNTVINYVNAVISLNSACINLVCS